AARTAPLGPRTWTNPALSPPARLPTAPALTFNSGSLTFLANNSPNVASAETVGAVTLASGQSTINAGFAAAAAAGATSKLTAASLARVSGATANFIGGAGHVTPLGTPPN